MERVCGNCGKVIEPTKGGRAKFCSSECYAIDANAKRRAAVVERRAAAGLRCKWCAVPFGTDRRLSSRFCDQTCNDHFRNHARSTVDARLVKDARKPCEFCGGQIPATRRGGTIFCSYRCKNASGNVPSEKRRVSNRRYMLMYTRGITVEAFDAMVAAQNGQCRICTTTEPGGRRGTFAVDHCHVTGKVRGLLCNHCNLGLGHFRDDPVLLEAAAAYLRGHVLV